MGGGGGGGGLLEGGIHMSLLRKDNECHTTEKDIGMSSFFFFWGGEGFFHQ